MENFQAEALLSVQRALWDLVTPNLRGVKVGLRDPDLDIRFIFENEPTPDDLENMSEAETCVMADFPPDVTVRARAEWLPTAQRRTVDSDEMWVYLRKETTY